MAAPRVWTDSALRTLFTALKNEFGPMWEWEKTRPSILRGDEPTTYGILCENMAKKIPGVRSPGAVDATFVAATSPSRDQKWSDAHKRKRDIAFEVGLINAEQRDMAANIWKE